MLKQKELLRKQMQLLAEQSELADEKDLAILSSSMCEVYKTLKRPALALRIALGFAVLTDLLICFFVLVVYFFR